MTIRFSAILSTIILVTFPLLVCAQELEVRMKDNMAHIFRAEEVRNIMHKKPFVIDVFRSDQRSTGVGFFIKEDGTALTSYHVIANGQNISTTIEGVVYFIDVIGYDEVLDISVIKVRNFQSIPFVLVKNDAQSGGKVSILDKRSPLIGKVLRSSENFFVFDIEISQGFSGSPVFCGEGVCGIITSFEKSTNHAIATKVLKSLKNLQEMFVGENFKKKKFDFYVMDLQKYDAISIDELNLSNNVQNNLGVLVTYSGDENLQTWDVITHINGEIVNKVEDLQAIITKIYADESVTFTLIRAKSTISVTIS